MKTEMYTEERPWGSFTILEESSKFKVKRITVNPGGRLSYQYHHKREENWIVVKGIATIVLEGVNHKLRSGQSIFIPMGAKHRIMNETSSDVVFVEVQTGSYFGEDDIVRLEDVYNRK